jgi:hypothetical protein
MKKKLYSTFLIAVSAVLVIVTAACGAATPAPVLPTVAQVVPSATATQPSAATAQPTAAATQPAATAPSAATAQPTAAATQPAAAGPGQQGIVAAFAKTKTASAFKVSEKLSGSGTIVQLSPGMPTSVVLNGLDGEFKGKDYHVKLSGLAGSLFSDDPTKGIEVTQIGGKTYVHGPASALNAPQDNWYVLDSNSGFTMSVSVPDNLDSLAATNGDWSRFQKSRSDSLDGRKCDVYSAGKEAAGATIATVSQSFLKSVVAESGSVEMWICDDGYLHLLNASVQAHDETTPAKTGKIDLTFHIFEQGGNIVVAAPANALAAVSSNGAAPTSEPTSPPDAQPTPDDSTTTTQPGGVTSTTDSAQVVQQFFDAVNQKDVDTAVSLVTDDVIVNAGSTVIMGKDDLKSYLQKQIARNVTYTPSKLTDTGGIVNFSLQTSDQTSAVGGNTAIVDSGQIQIMTLH